MSLKTKCILKEKELSDGKRISIMSRHTLNDGVTPHPEITEHSFDLHYPELAPVSKLIGDYYKRGLPWKDFEERFRSQLSSITSLKRIEEISTMALTQNVTLLCIEAIPEKCHRRMVAEFCHLMQPSLVVEYN